MARMTRKNQEESGARREQESYSKGRSQDPSGQEDSEMDTETRQLFRDHEKGQGPLQKDFEDKTKHEADQGRLHDRYEDRGERNRGGFGADSRKEPNRSDRDEESSPRQNRQPRKLSSKRSSIAAASKRKKAPKKAVKSKKKSPAVSKKAGAKKRAPAKKRGPGKKPDKQR